MQTHLARRPSNCDLGGNISQRGWRKPPRSGRAAPSADRQQWMSGHPRRRVRLPDRDSKESRRNHGPRTLPVWSRRKLTALQLVVLPKRRSLYYGIDILGHANTLCRGIRQQETRGASANEYDFVAQCWGLADSILTAGRLVFTVRGFAQATVGWPDPGLTGHGNRLRPIFPTDRAVLPQSNDPVNRAPPRACVRAAQSSQVGLRYRSAHIPTTGTAASRTLSNVAMCGP
jgi:hypothetical protein